MMMLTRYLVPLPPPIWDTHREEPDSYVLYIYKYKYYNKLLYIWDTHREEPDRRIYSEGTALEQVRGGGGRQRAGSTEGLRDWGEGESLSQPKSSPPLLHPTYSVWSG
jgi:hypothetical protein